MRHPLLIAWTGFRLRMAFWREDCTLREIREYMGKYDEAKFEEAVKKADELTNGEMSRVLSQSNIQASTMDKAVVAAGDSPAAKGAFLDWLTEFLNSELGKMLIELLMQLLIGLIGG